MADSKDIINELGGADRRLNDMHAIKEVLKNGGGGGIDITSFNTPCVIGNWFGKKIKMAVTQGNNQSDQAGTWGAVDYRPSDFNVPLMALIRGRYTGGDNGQECVTPCALRENYNRTKLEVMGNWSSGKLPYKSLIIIVYISTDDV